MVVSISAAPSEAAFSGRQRYATCAEKNRIAQKSCEAPVRTPASRLQKEAAAEDVPLFRLHPRPDPAQTHRRNPRRGGGPPPGGPPPTVRGVPSAASRSAGQPEGKASESISAPYAGTPIRRTAAPSWRCGCPRREIAQIAAFQHIQQGILHEFDRFVARFVVDVAFQGDERRSLGPDPEGDLFPVGGNTGACDPRPMKKRFGSTRPASSTQYPLGRDRLDMQAASLTAELSGIR